MRNVKCEMRNAKCKMQISNRETKVREFRTSHFAFHMGFRSGSIQRIRASRDSNRSRL